MPDAMAAAASPCIGASGSSAITVTDTLAALSLPAVTPPNLRKSFSLISAVLPTPTTIRRSALIPSGAGISSVEPLLPLNWLAAAARLTVSDALPSAFRVASPNFNASSQNTTRTPRTAAEKATKPTLTASDIGKSSRISGHFAGPEPARIHGMFSSNRPKSLRACRFRHYGPQPPALPSARRDRTATWNELLTVSRGRHGPAILLTDQRDGRVCVDG